MTERRTRKHQEIYMAKYSFSGHETFYCKSLWLKKGYDFLKEGNSFNDEDAVIKLGVGKNMVSSIRYWLKACGLTIADQTTPLADLLLDSETGVDKFLEDIDTLWILHYHLIENQIASLYHLLFVEYQSEKKEFDKETLKNFIKRQCNISVPKSVYNENTLKKDIDVLLKNYISPANINALEDFSALFIPLNMLQKKYNRDNFSEKESFFFIQHRNTEINPLIIMYVFWDMKGEGNILSFDKLQEIACIFGLSFSYLVDIIRVLEKKFPKLLHYSENSGVRNVQFLSQIDKYELLKTNESKL